MNKKIIKKAITLLLATALLATLIPASSRAYDFFNRAYVHYISVRNIIKPEAGIHPVFDAYLDQDVYKYKNKEFCRVDKTYNKSGFVNGVKWYDLTEGTTLTPDDIFKEGHKYRVYVTVRCSGDYVYFSEDAEASFDDIMEKTDGSIMHECERASGGRGAESCGGPRKQYSGQHPVLYGGPGPAGSLPHVRGGRFPGDGLSLYRAGPVPGAVS